MGQNAVVCVGLVGVCVSGDGLSGCDWVVGTGVWDLGVGVCVVVVGGWDWWSWVVCKGIDVFVAV